MSGKSAFLLVALVGLVAVVYGVSVRLTTEAINVIVGVLCGVGAGIPLSLGLLLALTRERRRVAEESDEEWDGYSSPTGSDPRAARPAYPPVIVVAPPQSALPNPYAPLGPPALPPGYTMHEPPRSRDFKIVGDEDDLGD